jgi:hypothetical protein
MFDLFALNRIRLPFKSDILSIRYLIQIVSLCRVVTVAMAALLASAAIASYSSYVSAKKYGDSNSQSSTANNDCPSELLSLIIGIQLQTSANCLNDLNSVQDSNGAAISSAPSNTALGQTLGIELEFGDDNGSTLEEICGDGIDNGGDGIDNGGDGKIDDLDPDCA